MEEQYMNITTQREGSALTVFPEGRIDTLTAPAFEQCLEAELGDADRLLIDFSKVNYISSAGLRVLLTYAQEMEERGGSIQAVGVNDTLRKVFSLTGFLETLNID